MTKFRYLIIEEDTEEGRKAVRLMNNSRLRYDLHRLSSEEVLRDGKPVPRLGTHVGFFDDLESIEWYVKAYGFEGRAYEPDKPDDFKTEDLVSYFDRILH